MSGSFGEVKVLNCKAGHAWAAFFKTACFNRSRTSPYRAFISLQPLDLFSGAQ
jgi:hypothetical protein